MKCALLAVFVAVCASSCGLFERNGTQERKVEVVTAVAHEALAAALPRAVADWTRDSPKSSLNTSGNYQMARATVTFEKNAGNERGALTVEIVDGLHVPSVKSRLALMMHGADDVHRMALQVAGYHGVQQWQPEKNAVGAHLVVANRFLVTLTGTHVSQDVFHQALNGIDVGALESLIGATPPAARPTAGLPSAATTVETTTGVVNDNTAAPGAATAGTATSGTDTAASSESAPRPALKH